MLQSKIDSCHYEAHSDVLLDRQTDRQTDKLCKANGEAVQTLGTKNACRPT